MKVERHGHNDRTPSVLPAMTVMEPACVAKGNRFATAVREYHKRDAPAPNRPQRPAQLPETGDRCPETPTSALGAMTLEPLCATEVARPSPNPERIASIQSTVGARDSRRKTGAAPDHDAPPCIEVEHSVTGTRFMLSRSDGVWLLTVQAAATSLAGVPEAINAIRARFDQLGLGQLDILIA